jgi:hypothetical protein
LVLAAAPVDPRGTMIFRPDMAAKPGSVDFHHPAQNGCGGLRDQGASKLMKSIRSPKAVLREAAFR